MVSTVRRLTPLALLGWLALALPTLAFAQDAPPAAISVSPPRLEIGVTPGQTAVEAKLSVTNLGPTNQVVTAALNDLFVTKSGAYEAVTPDQTPYSVAHMGTLNAAMVDLAPAGSSGASREVVLSIDLPEQPEPRYGAIVVKPASPETSAPEQPNGGGAARVGVKVITAVLVPVLVVPLGAEGRTDVLAASVHLGLEPVSLDVRQATSDGLLDHLLPLSLPHVADHGPLTATASVRNTGDAFARAFTHVQFTSVHLLSWLPASLRSGVGIRDSALLEADVAPGAAMPGEVAETGANTEIVNQGHRFDTVPLVGLVRVHAQTKMMLVDASTNPVAQDGWILVLPWKELLALGLLFALASGARARWRRRGPRPALPPPASRPAPWSTPLEPALPRHEVSVEGEAPRRPAAEAEGIGRQEEPVQAEVAPETEPETSRNRGQRRED